MKKYKEEDLIEFRNQLRKFKQNNIKHTLNILEILLQASLTFDQITNTKIASTIQSLTKLTEQKEQQNQYIKINQISKLIIQKWIKIKPKSQQKIPSNNSIPSLKKIKSNETLSLSKPSFSENPLEDELPQFNQSENVRNKGLSAIYSKFINHQSELSINKKTLIEICIDLEESITERNRQIENYKQNLTEVLGMFTSKEIIIEVIEKIVTKEVLIKDVAYAKSAVFMLEQEKQEKIKQLEDEFAVLDPEFYNNLRRSNYKGMEGEKCRNCKKLTAFLNKELQTRAADEPMTRFMECNNCRKKWRE